MSSLPTTRKPFTARTCAWCWKQASTPTTGGISANTLITNALRTEGLISSASRYLHVGCIGKARRALRSQRSKHARLVRLIEGAL